MLIKYIVLAPVYDIPFIGASGSFDLIASLTTFERNLKIAVLDMI